MGMKSPTSFAGKHPFLAGCVSADDPAYFRHVVQQALDAEELKFTVTCEIATDNIWRLDIWDRGKVLGGVDFAPTYQTDADIVAKMALEQCRRYADGR